MFARKRSAQGVEHCDATPSNLGELENVFKRAVRNTAEKLGHLSSLAQADFPELRMAGCALSSLVFLLKAQLGTDNKRGQSCLSLFF